MLHLSLPTFHFISQELVSPLVSLIYLVSFLLLLYYFPIYHYKMYHLYVLVYGGHGILQHQLHIRYGMEDVKYDAMDGVFGDWMCCLVMTYDDAV